MQLSNEPAEELASMLLESAKGAFELCGFLSGGQFDPMNYWCYEITDSSCLGSEAMESVIKLARQVSTRFKFEISTMGFDISLSSVLVRAESTTT